MCSSAIMELKNPNERVQDYSSKYRSQTMTITSHLSRERVRVNVSNLSESRDDRQYYRKWRHDPHKNMDAGLGAKEVFPEVH